MGSARPQQGMEMVVPCVRLRARGWVLGVDKTPTCVAV